MIGTIDIKVNAAHPNIALDELHAFLDSPSSVRVLNVPRKIGSWQITGVKLVVEYPDNQVHSVECRLVGGVYVGTIAGSSRTGKCVNGFSVVADGVDENGDVVEGYVLGVGDVVISDRSVTAEPEERTEVLRLRENATDPKRGDALCNDDGIKFYTGDGWLNCPDFQLSDYYTKEQTDGIIDGLSDEYLTSETDPVFSALSGNFLTSHQSLSDYAEVESLKSYLPLSGGTLNGDLEFSGNNGLVIPPNGGSFKYLIYGRNGTVGRYYKWQLPINGAGLNMTLALRSDLSDISLSGDLSNKVDAEERFPTRTIPLGLYWGRIYDSSAADLIVESSGAFTDCHNTYEANFVSGGIYVECTYARKKGATLVQNDTKGTSTGQEGVPIFFAIGDVGRIHDGDEDYDSVCVVSDIVEELGPVKMTIGESISARLSAYLTEETEPAFASLSGTFLTEHQPLSDCISRTSNTMTSPGVVTDYLASNLVGGIRVRFSAHNLDNYTAYAYGGVAVRRNRQTDDYLFDATKPNGFARRSDVSAIVEAYLSAYGITGGA